MRMPRTAARSSPVRRCRGVRDLGGGALRAEAERAADAPEGGDAQLVGRVERVARRGVEPRAALGRLATRTVTGSRSATSGPNRRPRQSAAAMPATSSSTIAGLTHGGVSSPSDGSAFARSVSLRLGTYQTTTRMPAHQVQREGGVAVLGEVLVREERPAVDDGDLAVAVPPTSRPKPSSAG